MKKFICLLLAALICAALFTGCGKFDMENADISEYVELGDISVIPYKNLVKAYEDYREYLSEGMVSCAVSEGYTIDFLVKAELLDENGKVLSTVDKWTHNTENDMVKGYDVYRTNMVFDDGLVYNTTKADLTAEQKETAVGRTIEIGKEFYFTLKIGDDYEDEAFAGKTVKFTVNVKKALPAVYPNSTILERLQNFFAAARELDKDSEKTIKDGDTITIDYKLKVDGETKDSASNYMFVVGDNYLIEGLEEQLIGRALNEKFDATVTLPEDYKTQELAGKEAVFSIEVKDIYNDLELIKNNTPFNDMWELKYALRVEMYISYALVTYVEDQSKLIDYPEKLLKRFEKIFESYVARDVAEKVLEYAEQGKSYSKKEMKKILYPNGSDKTYVEEGSKAAAYSYMIAVAIQRELGLSYTEEDIQKDLQKMADEYTT